MPTKLSMPPSRLQSCSDTQKVYTNVKMPKMANRMKKGEMSRYGADGPS
jgi:hypothetical protein